MIQEQSHFDIVDEFDNIADHLLVNVVVLRVIYCCKTSRDRRQASRSTSILIEKIVFL